MELLQIGWIGVARLAIARAIVPRCYAVVPREPTRAMIKAACASMSPGKRPTPDWVTQEQALDAAKKLARAEQDALDAKKPDDR